MSEDNWIVPPDADYEEGFKAGAEQERRRTNKIIESMYDCGFDAEDTEERRENISISNRWFTEMSELEIDQAAYEDGYNNGKKDGAEQERRRIERCLTDVLTLQQLEDALIAIDEDARASGEEEKEVQR